MKFLWTDDKTHQFSDTTLRTWLLFFLFFFTALAMIAIEVILPGHITERAITLLDIAAVAAGGGGALYLGKRVNERNDGSTKVVLDLPKLPSENATLRAPYKTTGGAP